MTGRWWNYIPKLPQRTGSGSTTGTAGFADSLTPGSWKSEPTLIRLSLLVCSRRTRFCHTMNGSHQASSHQPKRLMFAITLVFALPASLLAQPAQVAVLMSGGFSAAYQELLPQFESTGITITTARGASRGDGPTTIGAQLRRGLPADVVILSREGLAELLAEGRIVIGSDVDLASV